MVPSSSMVESVDLGTSDLDLLYSILFASSYLVQFSIILSLYSKCMKTEYSDAVYYVDVMTCSKAFSCGMKTVEAELDYYYPTLVRVFDFIDYSSVSMSW